VRGAAVQGDGEGGPEAVSSSLPSRQKVAKGGRSRKGRMMRINRGWSAQLLALCAAKQIV